MPYVTDPVLLWAAWTGRKDAALKGAWFGRRAVRVARVGAVKAERRDGG